MRICVIGAGAIGGLMGAKMALAGEEVTVVDQGAHLNAIKQGGLKLNGEDGTEYTAAISHATDDLKEAGEHDLVILALKAHYLEAVAPQMPAVTNPDTMIITVQNGIPWWYFHKHGGEFDGHRLETLDPNGTLSKYIDCDKIIGCVVYPAAAVTEPGVIHHVEGDRLPVGELDGSKSARVQTLHDVLLNASFRPRILDDIRSETWLKLWGNISFNPISALTHATLEDICQFRETRKLAENMMHETQAIAESLGITFRHTIEKRIAGAKSVGAHKTSMLQDVEAGRSLETEALIGSVLELGDLTKIPTPSIEAVYACIKLLNKIMVLEGAGIRVSDAA